MEASVVLFKCKTGKPFGARVERGADGDWHRTWAFEVDERTIQGEGYDKTEITSISSFLPETPEYPGCPYCGAKGFIYCHVCHKLTCWTGESYAACQWCGSGGEVGQAKDKFDISGTGY